MNQADMRGSTLLLSLKWNPRQNMEAQTHALLTFSPLARALPSIVLFGISQPSACERNDDAARDRSRPVVFVRLTIFHARFFASSRLLLQTTIRRCLDLDECDPADLSPKIRSYVARLLPRLPIAIEEAQPTSSLQSPDTETGDENCKSLDSPELETGQENCESPGFPVCGGVNGDVAYVLRVGGDGAGIDESGVPRDYGSVGGKMRGEVAGEREAPGRLVFDTEAKGGGVLMGGGRGGGLINGGGWGDETIEGGDEIGDGRVGIPGGEGRGAHARRDAAEMVADAAGNVGGMWEKQDVEVPRGGEEASRTGTMEGARTGIVEGGGREGGGEAGGRGGRGGGRSKRGEREDEAEATIGTTYRGHSRQLNDSGKYDGGGRCGETSNEGEWTVLALSGWRADEIDALLEVSKGYKRRCASPAGNDVCLAATADRPDAAMRGPRALGCNRAERKRERKMDKL